tara:strand:- start:1480 stop:2979 length:1500 start_codon:yes stop_codon:yes gene_type:complete
MQDLPVKDLYPSPHNNRTSFEVESLAASIKAQGLIEPIVVRKQPTKAGTYEIVCGERRWRATKHAGLTTIAAIVRALSDEEAREITLAENMQREDLSALEQAQGVQAYLDMGWPIARIAKQLGQTRQWIASRAQICKLTDLWKTAVDEPEQNEYQLNPIAQYPIQHLEEVSKLADVDQDNLFKALSAKSYVPSIGALREEILKRTRFLKDAPFPMEWKIDSEDGKGVPDCNTCTLRQGASPDLFGINTGLEASKDICQSGKCFKRKAELWRRHRLSEERKKVKAALETKTLSSELVLDLRRHADTEWDSEKSESKVIGYFYSVSGLKDLADERFEKCLKADDGARKGMYEGTMLYVHQTTNNQVAIKRREKEQSKNDLKSAVEYANRQQLDHLRKNLSEELLNTTTVISVEMTVALLMKSIEPGTPLMDLYDAATKDASEFVAKIAASNIDRLGLYDMQFMASVLKLPFDNISEEAETKHPFPVGKQAERIVNTLRRAA